MEFNQSSLEERKRLIRLSLMHKIHIKVVPGYLTPLIPVLVGERTQHNLGNTDILTVDMKRLSKSRSSYVS